MLSAQNLSINRGGQCVVRSLNAELKPGTLTAICGPNGAGKSSLIMALAGLLPPSSGHVTFDGAAISTLSAKQRARLIGYLPQGSDIAWDVTVENIVALGRYPFGDEASAQGRDAVTRALTATQMESFSDRPISQLSGGEKARALLARVLAGEPQWVLVDEPLAALDLAHQLRMIAHLRDCARAGQGVVIVLHDLAIAMNYADRVLVLNDGDLIADGPPQQALSSGHIAKAWGVDAKWLCDAEISTGQRALIINSDL